MYALQGPEKIMLRAAPSGPEPHVSLLDISIFSIRSDSIRSIICLRSNRIEEAGDRIVSIRSRGESRSNWIELLTSLNTGLRYQGVRRCHWTLWIRSHPCSLRLRLWLRLRPHRVPIKKYGDAREWAFEAMGPFHDIYAEDAARIEFSMLNGRSAQKTISPRSRADPYVAHGEARPARREGGGFPLARCLRLPARAGNMTRKLINSRHNAK